MAVVFISPKKRQRTFFMGITASLVVFLIFISLWVFLAQPKLPVSKLAFNKPKVTIDLGVLDSDQFKQLEHFELMPMQFKYVGVTIKKQTVRGFISAVSKEEAIKILEEKGLTVQGVEEAGIGRDNPFIPYSNK